MTDRPYDALVFIGRFQPFHLGHKAVIDRALTLAEQVIVLAGSADQSRTLRNPFTWQERARMILGAYPANQGARLLITPLADCPGSDAAWVRQVETLVRNIVVEDARIGLIGHSKDNSSYYLRLFPAWAAENVGLAGRIDGVTIRAAYLRALAEGLAESWRGEVLAWTPPSTLQVMHRLAGDAAVARGLAEAWRQAHRQSAEART